MTMDTRIVLESLLAGQNLSEATAYELLSCLAAGRLDPAVAGGILIALRQKGEHADEIRGFALAMRALARQPNLPPGRPYVDIVGTGGDSSGSLNLSTGSALLAAACGLQVVKHGNRSVSSQSGSADVLAALGLPMPLESTAAADCLAAVGFTFLFAPHFHPAMRHIAPVRGALGVRTVFNILGPLTNPAQPPFHVIGAFSEAVAEQMAETLAGMPLKRAFVVHGTNGWDEATPASSFVCYDVAPGSIQKTIRDPSTCGLEHCDAAELVGSDAETNAQRLAAALAGGDTQAHRDALVLGAALALEVTGEVASLAAGVERARGALARGDGKAVLAGIGRFASQQT